MDTLRDDPVADAWHVPAHRAAHELLGDQSDKQSKGGIKMHHVREIMSRDVVHVSPTDTIRHAAELMRRYDIGALPVCDHRKVAGMVTDRDLAVRALASGKSLDAPVRDVCTPNVEWCTEDDDLDEVQQRMADAQLRRMPVINKNKELVGVLSLGDIATRSAGASHDEVANTLEGVSQARHH